MSSINPRTAELLQLLLNAPDHEAGIAVVELPDPLRDWKLLTACEGEGLIEFVRPNHCHVGGQLVLEPGWNVAQLAMPNRKRVKELLTEVLAEQVPTEIRHRVRLTYKGDSAATALELKDSPASAGETGPWEASPGSTADPGPSSGTHACPICRQPTMFWMPEARSYACTSCGYMRRLPTPPMRAAIVPTTHPAPAPQPATLAPVDETQTSAKATESAIAVGRQMEQAAAQTQPTAVTPDVDTTAANDTRLESAFARLLAVMANAPRDAAGKPINAEQLAASLISPLSQVGRAIEQAGLRGMLLDQGDSAYWDVRNTTGEWARILLQQSHAPDPLKVREYLSGPHRLEDLANHFRRFLSDALMEKATLEGTSSAPPASAKNRPTMRLLTPTIATLATGDMEIDAIVLPFGLDGASHKFPIRLSGFTMVPGEKPSVCPRAEPQIPAEYLPEWQDRLRDWGRLPNGQTLHWIGYKRDMDHICMCYLAGDDAAVQVAEVGSKAATPKVQHPFADDKPALDNAREQPRAVHNADFTMVKWFGTEYHFALGIQSLAVKALWQEWERSGMGLHQETIRDAIDPERDSFRLDTAFRKHPALNTMIQRCGDGRYRLAPPSNQSVPGQRSKRNTKITPKSRRKRG